MKEVFDISLQGVSFKIEKDAFELLENYIDELKVHYGKQEEEVVNDIEERISELLFERGCTGGTVVQMHHVEDIIKVLGRPNEIDGQQGISGENKVKKGIYRDTQNGIVAGVCSGLGAYFNMDAVWVRVIFILVAILFTAPSFFVSSFLRIDIGWFGFMLLAYLILWIIIPEAKTVSQRCAMRGEPQSIDHIHRKFAQGAREVGSEMWSMGTKATGTFFSTLWRIICFTVGVILTIIGFGGIVALGVVLFSVDMITGIPVLSIPDFMELNIGSTLWLKIFGLLTVLLPCVGMLYAGIRLCFRFKAPKWRPGLINFLVWLVCALVFTLGTVKAFSPYYVDRESKEQIELLSTRDTLYLNCIKMPGMENAKMSIDASGNHCGLFYLDNAQRKNTSFAVYPDIAVRRIETGTPYIEVKTVNFSKPDFYEASASGMKISDVVAVQDSLVTVKPAIYSRTDKFSGTLHKVVLYVPEDTKVVMQEPVKFVFGESASYRSGIRAVQAPVKIKRIR